MRCTLACASRSLPPVILNASITCSLARSPSTRLSLSLRYSTAPTANAAAADKGKMTRSPA